MLAATCLEAFGAADKITFDFYGRSVELEAEAALTQFQFNNRELNYYKVSSQLKAMHALGLDHTFRKLEKSAKEMSLDNLGYLQLLKVFSMKAFPEQTPAFRISLVWYGLRHKGIDALLAGQNDYINLFVRMDQEMDGGFSMTHLGKKYYSATREIPYSALEVYRLPLLQDSSYNGIEIIGNSLPNLGNNIASKPRSFWYGNREYKLSTKYNADLVNYMNDLPRFRVGRHMYLVKTSPEAGKSLDDSLVVWMKNMSQSEKQSFLLALVQKAFPYKADRDYRKYEKRNFIEQTLADDFTDCEDKAALYCYLAEKYLNAKTILIYSKNLQHVNCAVEMPANAPGYSFKYGNKPYLIMEPAFSGYKPGETDMLLSDLEKAVIFD